MGGISYGGGGVPYGVGGISYGVGDVPSAIEGTSNVSFQTPQEANSHSYKIIILLGLDERSTKCM